MFNSDSSKLDSINEMFIDVAEHLPDSIELGVYYAKLKAMLHSEIIKFCKEKTDLKMDLNMLRMSVGEPMPRSSIVSYLDALKERYNTTDDNIGIDYHIEETRIDYGVSVFVIIKRNIIYFKKFVFRFKKGDMSNPENTVADEHESDDKTRLLKLMED